FLVLDTADVEAMTAALRRTWAAYEPIAGRGSARIANTVVTRTLPSIAERVHVIRLYRVGSAGPARAAERVVAEALTAALPADLRHWLDGGTVRPQATFESTYRELATSRSRDARNCRAGVTAACVGALGLTDADPASREVPEPPLGA